MGRPREYDEAALVSHAMHAFWSRGYRGMSIDELVSKTGVSRASLYNAYPDKRGLFIESLKRYLDEIVHDNVRRLYAVEPAGEAVRQFLLKLVEAPLARLRRGCLLTNTAVELGIKDKQAAALIRQAFERVEDALHQRLVEAKKAGNLAGNMQPRSYARQLMTVLQGIRVMARVGVERDILKDAVRAALSPLDSGRKLEAVKVGAGKKQTPAKKAAR
jgi:TetR/AcrR family transcriptional regulator, transcriptional repressor for nem operon